MLLSCLRNGSPPKVKMARLNSISGPGDHHQVRFTACFPHRFASIETLRPAKHLRSCQDTAHTTLCLNPKIGKHRSPEKGTCLPIPMYPPSACWGKGWRAEVRDWMGRALFPHFSKVTSKSKRGPDQCPPIRLARVMVGPLHNTAPEPQSLGQTVDADVCRSKTFGWLPHSWGVSLRLSGPQPSFPKTSITLLAV